MLTSLIDICTFIFQVENYPPFSGITYSLAANGFKISRSGFAILLEIGNVLIKYSKSRLAITIPGNFANQVSYNIVEPVYYI